jgi:UDP-N-acetylmuramate dehydrogenase
MTKLNNKEANSRLKDQIKSNYSLNKNSWFGIGGEASFFFQPQNREDLKSFLTNFKFEKFITIGSGSNILFRDSGFQGVVIKLGKEFAKIEDSNSCIVAGAAALKNKVSEFAKTKGFSEFEFLSSIPGTVGGGVFMNAGCFGSEMSDIIDQITVMNLLGKEKTITRKEIKFNYRKSGLPKNYIVLDVLFRKTKNLSPLTIEKNIQLMKNQKKINQPSGIRTGGSTFKNPASCKLKAWELIKKYGCDELFFGNAKFSEHHCNFIDNTNLASSEDMEKLIKKTQKKVLKNSGIKLELEIKII